MVYELFFWQNSPQMGQSFWQKNSFITHISTFRAMPIVIFSPVYLFMRYPLLVLESILDLLFHNQIDDAEFSSLFFVQKFGNFGLSKHSLLKFLLIQIL